jgi:hypothetical protein
MAKAPTTAAKKPRVKLTKAGADKPVRIGNPKFAPTDEQRKFVETHAACGTPHWLIALELKIAESTLYQHFRYELDTGLLRLNARIGSLVAKQALNGWIVRRSRCG